MRSSESLTDEVREWRRFRAVELAEAGLTHEQISVALGVTKVSVGKWLALAKRCGVDALRSRPHPGPPAKLTADQLRVLPDFLWHGAEAYGFEGEVWTCARVAGVLAQEFGVSYSKSQVCRLLKSLGWTPQLPITRAIQRDEEKIAHWRRWSWPALKRKVSSEHLTLIFVDESGFYLQPGLVRTYAPQGQRPILQEWQTRDHLSIMGAITVKGKIYSLVRQTSLNGMNTIEFLIHLMRLAGKRLLVVWDGSPIHRRAEVKAFLAERACKHVQVEALPPYAPDLNPVEWLWQHLKDVELRNLSCLDLEHLHMEFHVALGRIRQQISLIHSFFQAAGLKL